MSLLMIKNGYVITVDKDLSIYPNGAIVIKGNVIEAIGETEVLEKKYGVSIQRVIDAAGHAVLPGLINTHLHSGLIRGTAEDLPVFEWLQKHIDPKHKVLRSEDAYCAARLCYGESLKSGTTCVLDMYRYMDRCADAAEETGIRAVLAPYVADETGYDYFENVKGNTELIEKRHGSSGGRIHVWYGLEHLSYCTEKAFRDVARMAKHYDVGIHTHGEESLQMTYQIHQKYGQYPLEVFWKRGIMGSKTVLAHCVWLMPVEIEILKETGASVAHCPVSNMKLASGVAPVTELLQKGIIVSLGTDGVKENNNLDLLEEMKFASLLQKVHLLDATVMPAIETLKLATINGAKALGLDHEIGSLEPGKKADLILIDLQNLHMAPLLESGEFSNILTNLVFSANGNDVRTVLVDGTIVVEDGKVITIDEQEVIAEAKKITEALFERRRPFVPQ